MSAHDSKNSEKNQRKAISLGRNISWSLLGNIVYAASQWGILILFTRFTSQEDVGRFALALAITTPVIFFSNLQLRSVLATDKAGLYVFSHYRDLRFLTSALALLLFFGIALVLDYGQETAAIIMVMGVAKSIEALADMYHGSMQAYERMDKLSQSLMWKGVLSLGGSALVLFLGGSMLSACLMLCMVWLIIFLVFDIPQTKAIQTHQTQPLKSTEESWSAYGKKIYALTKVSLPLGFVMLLISINFNFPRFVLERYVGEAQLGIFAALSYIVIAGNLFIQSMGQSVTPRLSELHFLDKREEFHILVRRILLASAGVGILGVLGAILLGRFIIGLLYGEAYAQNNNDFILIMLTGGVNFVASILWYITTAMRGFHQSVIPFVLTALTTIGASYALIPAYGMTGAALAMLLSNLVNITLLWKLMKDLERSKDEN